MAVYSNFAPKINCQQALEVTIQALTSSGEGVARLADGRVVFVSGALPGDRVLAHVQQRKKNLLLGTLGKLLQSSPQRVASHCGREGCGGCVLRDFHLTAQRQAKRQRIVDAFQRIAGINVAEQLADVHGAGEGWRYRHRVRLHAAWHERGFALGYYAPRSHRLVSLQSCPVLWPELEGVAVALARLVSDLPRVFGVETIEVAYSRRDQRAAASVQSSGSCQDWRGVWRRWESTGLAGVQIRCKDGEIRHGNLELRYDHAEASEYDLAFEPGVFTQANPSVNNLLMQRVVELVRPRQQPRVVEFHAGIGNFSIPLARRGAQVVAVEASPRAAVLLGRNARASGLTIPVHKIADSQASSLAAEADLVLLDPPRLGALDLVRDLAVTKPPRIIYVSCDPATLARDACELLQAGYRVTDLWAGDMFGQTPHVETIAAFERS